MNKLYIILPALTIASATWAMDPNNNNQVTDLNADNSYHGTQITPENIAQLLQPIPQETATAFYAFTAQHPQLLPTLVKFEPANFKQNFKDAHKALMDANITNKSNNGGCFVFNLPTYPIFMVQGSLQENKVYNKSAEIVGIGNGWNHCHDNYMQDKKLDELKEVDPTTYQTVSRAAFYLMIKQELNKLSQPSIQVPSTYLIAIDGQSHTRATDATHVVVQEAFDTAKFVPVKDNAHLIKKEALQQLLPIISATKLFSVTDLHVNKETGELLVIDIEQANDEPATSFFHKRNNKIAQDYERGNKGKTKAEHDAQMGFQSLIKILNPDQKELVKAFINDCTNFSTYSEQGYKEIRDLAK